MLKKFLPLLLLLTGCANEPTVPVETLQASVGKPVVKPEDITSMFRSDDLGRSWTPMGKGLPNNLQVAQLGLLDQQLVLASYEHGVYLSDPEKQSWQQLDTTSLPSLHIHRLLVADGVIYAAVRKHGIYASHDRGKSWASLNYDRKDAAPQTMLRVGNELWVGAENGINVLQDGTHTWRQIFGGTHVSSLLWLGENIVAGTRDGIALSGDKGASWDWLRKDITPANLMVVDGYIVVTPSNKQSVEVSGDLGKSWKTAQEGFQNERFVFEIVKAGNGLLSFQDDGIYQSEGWGGEWLPIYHFSFDEPFGVLLTKGQQWNAVYSRPEASIVKLMVVDGVVYGGTSRGC